MAQFNKDKIQEYLKAHPNTSAADLLVWIKAYFTAIPQLKDNFFEKQVYNNLLLSQKHKISAPHDEILQGVRQISQSEIVEKLEVTNSTKVRPGKTGRPDF